jgi:hypothetical protein
MSLMDNVSRPLIALLVGSVAFFALWMTALKPSSKSGGSPSSAYQSAIARAHQAVGVSAASSVAHGGTVVTTPSATATATPVTTTGAVTSKPATRAQVNPKAAAHASASTATQQRIDTVSRALLSKRVVALLFYNPAATDDRAVKHELAAVPSRGRKVVKVAVPISELTRYPVVTTQVQVNESPTLVLIDGHGQAMTITGFADRFEISQRVLDALTAG